MLKSVLIVPLPYLCLRNGVYRWVDGNANYLDGQLVQTTWHPAWWGDYSKGKDSVWYRTQSMENSWTAIERSISNITEEIVSPKTRYHKKRGRFAEEMKENIDAHIPETKRGKWWPTRKSLLVRDDSTVDEGWRLC